MTGSFSSPRISAAITPSTKLSGESLWGGEVDIKDKILVTSGRLSAEMMLKAAKLDVPVVVSRSAPTTLGIKIAEKMQITMIGLAAVAASMSTPAPPKGHLRFLLKRPMHIDPAGDYAGRWPPGPKSFRAISGPG